MELRIEIYELIGVLIATSFQIGVMWVSIFIEMVATFIALIFISRDLLGILFYKLQPKLIYCIIKSRILFHQIRSKFGALD